MGLGSYIERKREEYQHDKFRREAIEKKAESARWQAREKGTIARARAEGYKEGRTRGTGGGFFSHFQVDPTGGGFGGKKGGKTLADSFINPFASPGGSHRRSHRSGSRGGTATIKVNGTTITVHGKKTHHRRRSREPEFPF